MHLRAISLTCLLSCLAWLPACDEKGADTKPDGAAKAETKTDAAKTDETKVDAKVEEAKADEAKLAEAKAEEAKADDAKADDAKLAEAKAEEAKADAKVDDTKAAETKADPKKPDPTKADPKKPDTKKPDETKADPAPAGADGKDLYAKKCKSCHGASGDGKTKIGGENDIEDWTVAGWKAKWPESKVVDIVTNGKSGTKMKPFKDKLTAAEITAVSKYARSLGK